MISDNRRLEGVTNLDQLWRRGSWLPMAVATGIERIAVVVAPRGLGKLATKAIIGKFGKTSFETIMFESVADAEKWVSQP